MVRLLSGIYNHFTGIVKQVEPRLRELSPVASGSQGAITRPFFYCHDRKIEESSKIPPESLIAYTYGFTKLSTKPNGYSDTGYSDKSVTVTNQLQWHFLHFPNDWFASKLRLLTVTIWLHWLH